MLLWLQKPSGTHAAHFSFMHINIKEMTVYIYQLFSCLLILSSYFLQKQKIKKMLLF